VGAVAIGVASHAMVLRNKRPASGPQGGPNPKNPKTGNTGGSKTAYGQWVL
jgi:chitinase